MPALARALILALLVQAAPCGASEEPTVAIQRIKAAFLYKFAAYVEWPAESFADAASPIVIGVVGADAIAQELALVVAGRKLGSRPMQVRRLARDEQPKDCCQILFIGSASARVPELLAQAQGRPVLTVTEAEASHPKGSIINFLGVEDRVRFDISREAAERNRLQLRSQLLAVARQVS